RAAVEADLERVFGYFPQLRARRAQQAGTLSGGEQQMLAVSRALMLAPKLMLLDEPSFGLAPLLVRELFGILRAINERERAGMLYWPAFLLTVGIAFILGIFIERIVIRPVENAPVLGVVVVFIGLLVILNSVAGWIYTYTIKSFPSPFPRQPILGIHYISAHELGAIGVTLAVLALLYAFFRFTPLGLAMRAAAQNPESSRLVGIRVGWM